MSEQTSYTANFFDSEASNQSSATGATGKTTAKMTDDTPADNIYLAAGWDFAGESTNGTDDIWNIGSGYNSGYPFHSWEHPEADTPLPVTLVYFDACYVNGTINLNWQTASETENLAFRIYRDEEMIAEVEGAGTTSETAELYIYRSVYNPGQDLYLCSG
ncbi:MAG: hypothetical protein U5N26_07105 [Candidatus Marinimicrobia bacterium]|nr:hypothetical protein [Candidatus Neomarinimicrobiota bacterium]